MLRTAVAIAMIAASSLAFAQGGESAKTPQRIRSVQLTKGQACPTATGNEVVVCSTVEEPYRIPKSLRETKASAAKESWVNRAATIDQDGRRMAGLPDTCSPVGSGGQTGCALAINQQYAAEKRAKRQAQSDEP